ncbi:MAG: glycerol kinase GlpK [Geminicoccaceae bacterium]
MAETHILAIDQGTTSSRAIVFDKNGHIQGVGQRELTQYFPADGWVEHDANEIWNDTVAVSKDAVEAANLSFDDIAAIGITNQRETTVLWDRETGEPVHKAIVWQDRRTAPICRELASDGLTDHVQKTTGLVIDAYFAGTKLAWLLDNAKGAREAADAGKLAFGTIDSFLLWRLTGGEVHATDASNACRTMLMDIHRQDWDETLLKRLNIPSALLPEIRDNSTPFGTTQKNIFGREIPITGMAGDQQAASFGQACFETGMIKSTYGTGCFALLNTGGTAVPSQNQLLTTIAWRLGGQTTYALEGSIFVAGAAVQWLRDALNLVDHAAETEAIARSVDNCGGLYLVPAFTGLGAPHWDPDARGALIGLTRDSGRAQVVRATLESVGYQTADLMTAMAADTRGAGIKETGTLRVDGGMVANDWVCQFLADILDVPVERPEVIETTALGAAYLAGLEVGLFASQDDIAQQWRLEKRFEPTMPKDERRRLMAGWSRAVERVRG